MMVGAGVGAAVGAEVGADVGAAVGAEVGAAVGPGAGVLTGPGSFLSGCARRFGAGSAWALPSTTTLVAEDGAGTDGSAASPVVFAGLLPPPSSSPIPAMA